VPTARRVLNVLFAGFIGGTSLDAQSPRLGVDRAAVVGVILDSSTRQPPKKTRICPAMRTDDWWIAGPCAEPDSIGRYRLDDLLLTSIQLSVTCETAGLGEKRLAGEILAFTEPTEIHRDWIVSTAGCDPRPMRRITRTFTGFWTPGFEISEFIPCPVDSWAVPGDSLAADDNASAWARLAEGVRVPKWPEVKLDKWGNGRYYVEWRGTLEGPGHYGHMSLSSFSFVADSVIQIRAPRRGDCAPGAR
jgi:hypothetical protein